MTKQAVEALKDEVAMVIDLCERLDDADWAKPSACDGWTVKDVVGHLTANFDSVVNPGAGAQPEDDEPFTEPGVRASRAKSAEEIVAEFKTLSAAGIAALEGAQEPPAADMEIPIATLGTYPLHLVANALAFDHSCHVREDLVAPNGPLEIDVPRNDDALGATIEWLMAGLPQMNRDTLNALVTEPIVLELSGPGGGVFAMVPDGTGSFTVERDGTETPAATVVSTTDNFVRWSTKRAGWRDLATVNGDAAYAATVLDAIDLE